MVLYRESSIFVAVQSVGCQKKKQVLGHKCFSRTPLASSSLASRKPCAQKICGTYHIEMKLPTFLRCILIPTPALQ